MIFVGGILVTAVLFVVAALIPMDTRVEPADYLSVLSSQVTKLFTENISTLSGAEKMLWALQYEQFVNNSGGITDNDVNWKRAVAKLFGIDTSSQTATFAAKDILKGHQKDEGDTAKQLGKFFRIFLEGGMTGKEWAAMRGFYYSRHSEERWGKISARVVDNVHKSDKAKTELQLRLLFKETTGAE